MFHVEHFFKNMEYSIRGNIADIENRRFVRGKIHIKNGIIARIEEDNNINSDYFILPGFVDSHIHIESSMLVPSEFAFTAVKHGTVATVSDPHEIANVLGVKGVDFMIKNGKQTPFKFFFGAPSCVPATNFETSGAVINSRKVNNLLARDDIYFLSEMMNFPGVIHNDREVLKKMESSKKNNKKIDGHAPGLKGVELEKYSKQQIETDHECTTQDEAEEKIRHGMKIQIREGSAAKNFNELCYLISKYPDKIMLCSDDLHPDDLVKGHINVLAKRAKEKNIDIFNILRATSVNTIKHYNLNLGLLREGDPADFIQVRDINNFNVISTYINGEKVFDGEKTLFIPKSINKINKFNISEIKSTDGFKIKDKHGKPIRVIEAFDKSLFTKQLILSPKIAEGFIISDTSSDILKIVVINRYKKSKVSVGFIRNFGLKKGAIASSIAHDSHNIIAVGVNDNEILKVINVIIKYKGGIAVTKEKNIEILSLPIGGIMSDKPAIETAKEYKRMNIIAKELGCKLNSPFMTLSFMALLVIPELKIGDKGLFDVKSFNFTALFA